MLRAHAPDVDKDHHTIENSVFLDGMMDLQVSHCNRLSGSNLPHYYEGKRLRKNAMFGAVFGILQRLYKHWPLFFIPGKRQVWSGF